MWGGVKKRTHYGDIFKKWSASRGLEELRIALYKEPRPWYIAYSLHQCNHLLQDHHCARLLAWCTSIVELRPSLSAKQEAYQYTQEMFQLFMRHHKVGREALNEYLRLCAVGADLTSAFEWFKYWQEAQLDDCAALHTLTWLLQASRATPNDAHAEDMALTVMDLYTNRFAKLREGSAEEGGETGSAARASPAPPPLSHYEPTSPEDGEGLRRFFSVFKALAPRLQQHPLLSQFLDTMPLSVEEAEANCAAFGWPMDSVHRVFPQLEQHVSTSDYAPEAPLLYASTTPPRLRDSLLHVNFIAKLESSAESHSVADAVALVEEYERRVKEERERASGERTPALRKRCSEDELWHHTSDPSAAAYRRRLVTEGGITPELYHYLITALATTQPTAALRTLEGMEAANLRPLDLTRAALIVAVRDSVEDQRRLFRQQLEEMETRNRLDEDFDTYKVVEAYWKYDYTEFFHYRNALNRAQFYLFLLARLGPQPLQQLLLDTQTHGSLATAEDLVVLDEDLRQASRLFFRSRVGRGPVQAALDTISHHMPKLDISLMGTLPHFENYCVEVADDIAHSEGAIQALLCPYSTIYVLDTSFIETSESFLSLRAASSTTDKEGGDGAASQMLVLIPYLSLAQLASSVSSADGFTSFDPAMQQAIRSEPFLASQRLRALFAMLNASSARPTSPPSCTTASGEGKEQLPGCARRVLSRRTRVLHFTECLCANLVEQEVLDSFHLAPATNDNDQLLLVLAMLSCLKPRSARLVLCTDDRQLVKQLGSLQHSSLFGSAVEVISTAPPANLDLEKDLINDNPIWRDDLWSAAQDFKPQLDMKAELPPPDPSYTNDLDKESRSEVDFHQQDDGQKIISSAPGDASTAVEETNDSPWLALLEEQDELQAKDDMSHATPLLVSPRTPPGSSTPAGASTALSTASPDSASPAVLSSVEEEQELRDRLMSLYETPFDVVPVGVQMKEASALGSVFTEFDSMDPEQREARTAYRAAARSRLAQGEGGDVGAREPKRSRRRSMLEREMLANRGCSNKERFHMARRLSNQSGGRVPFSMRYRVVEANVRDPRNSHLRKMYEAGLEKKRAAFKRRHG
ncbi:hypothetical protein ABL78_6070 [Leptomonas seymouri]|uniref:Uncharacterized protein n=1 Tax=Leptomonas seymouri TaxID=5684 RepID=A0A0N1I2M1_LEPSE|nr:hypothetical protein ABL78_6070 [Leptomonas seymouri]|eukprot:KPI84888.1 hypothetical protein ABL78_6070 [Leptomonas seymouri]